MSNIENTAKGMVTRMIVLNKLEKQLLRMQREKQERLIIAKRESGEDNEYEFSKKELIEIEIEAIRECCAHYNKERLRYQYQGNEKRRIRMTVACDYLSYLIGEYVNDEKPKKRKARPVISIETCTRPFPQFNDGNGHKSQW